MFNSLRTMECVCNTSGHGLSLHFLELSSLIIKYGKIKTYGEIMQLLNRPSGTPCFITQFYKSFDSSFFLLKNLSF